MRCHCCRRAPPLQRPPHNACTRSRDALVCAFDPPEICPFALFKPWQKMDLGRPSLQWLAFLHLEWIWDLYIYFLPSHECLIWVWIDLHSWPSGRQLVAGPFSGTSPSWTREPSQPLLCKVCTGATQVKVASMAWFLM
ncbi:uncharacterized protein LOC122294577 isoform X2 [Carya illinoinensis]|uniref:uncharacterized protein LOC122294577 isoform X2 n=1 Tax=Carya illinoinensis TaxID=32201 RepID=UPI001C720829|nr:uncharacterized protein LOC122294577 isoform X2 [Carya illinoinensis]